MATTSNDSARSTASRLLASLSLLGALALPARADTADDYYHRGAQHYVFGDKEKAKTEVVTGVRAFPNDPKLSALAALLQKEEQEQQQKEQQQKQDQEKKDQQEQDKQKQQQQEKDQQNQEKKDQQQGQKPEDKKDPQEQPQPGGKSDKKDGEKKDGEQPQPAEEKDGEQPEGDAPPMRVLRMTPQQAIQLLETLKADEKAMPFRPPARTNKLDRLFKDW